MTAPRALLTMILGYQAWGYSYTEIGKILGVSRNCVAGQIFRHRHGRVKRIGTGKRIAPRARTAFGLFARP